MAGAGPGGCGHIPLKFGVGLEFMRNVIATSSERTYQGHFGDWVDVRVRCGMPVFLERCGDSMLNVWHLFEYVAYALRRIDARNLKYVAECFLGLYNSLSI